MIVEEVFSSNISRMIDEAKTKDGYVFERSNLNIKDVELALTYFYTVQEPIILAVSNIESKVWLKRVLRNILGTPDRTIGDELFYNRIPVTIKTIGSIERFMYGRQEVFFIETYGRDEQGRPALDPYFYYDEKEFPILVLYKELGLYPTDMVSMMRNTTTLEEKDIIRIVQDAL